jgi:hypothetical protein
MASLRVEAKESDIGKECDVWNKDSKICRVLRDVYNVRIVIKAASSW